MRQSQLFTKTRREAPKDEPSKNAMLLIRAGYVQKMQAGVYSYLPLGLRVVSRLKEIIRKEMNGLGGQEVELAALQEKGLWQATGRWDDAVVDNWFKSKLKNDTEVGLAFTHEEPLTSLLRDHVHSFRDLPTYIYQFQTKFRNEKRAKSGVMRGREFLMKDLYSFSRSEAEHAAFYEKVKEAYMRIFQAVGIGDKTYLTQAGGGSFSPFSHEFQLVTDAGEDTIYVDDARHLAVNKEVYTDEVIKSLGLDKATLKEVKAVEVGNIFNLSTKFSGPLELTYADDSGKQQPVIMGSYGIGVSRLVGAIVESLADDKGIVWPKGVAPFDVHLVYVTGSDEAKADAEALYKKLQSTKNTEGQNLEVLFDDRDARAGEKFADADLIGIPVRVTVSDKNKAENGAFMYEIKERASGSVKLVNEAELMQYMGA